MLCSLWLGVVLTAGESGCSSVNPQAPVVATTTSMTEVRQAETPGLTSGKPAKNAPLPPPPSGLRNPDHEDVPKAASPGAKVTYSSVHVNGPYIAMTFDDGPHPRNTPKLLDILKQRNIKATFFLVGENIREYPNIVRRILAEGHEIGNHTFKHPINMTRLSDEQARKEIADTAKALEEIAGYHCHLYRPPGGNTNAEQTKWVHDDFGYLTILWSVDPNDWKKPGVSVVQRRLISGAHPGAIMLSHDIHAPTIEAVPLVLDTLLAKGYQFVTVSQLINMEQPGPVVASTATSTTGGKKGKGKATATKTDEGGSAATPVQKPETPVAPGTTTLPETKP